MIKENERLDDLEYKSLFIIQNKDGYCFTSDSVILSSLVKVKPSDRVVDLCSGSGIIALLIAAKYNPKVVYAVELQEALAEMSKRSVSYNNYEKKVEVIYGNAKNIHKTIGGGFEVVVSNPPYTKVKNRGEIGDYTELEICKSEVAITAEEVVEEAAKLLKFGGLFYTVNKCGRLVDVIYSMRQNGIEPKTLYLVQPKNSKPADTFIVEGKMGGKPSLLVPRPIVVYNEDGTYTEEAKKLYSK